MRGKQSGGFASLHAPFGYDRNAKAQLQCSCSPILLALSATLIIGATCIFVTLTSTDQYIEQAVAKRPVPTPESVPARGAFSAHSEAAAGPTLVHIGTATDEAEPFGLIALVNSSISHSSEEADLRFHVIVPAAARRRLRLLLESLFPRIAFRMYTLDTGGARSKIIRHLRRHERETVLVSPFRYAHAYLPSLLPNHVRRILWFHSDMVLLTDALQLFSVPLYGAPVGAVQDCRRRTWMQHINLSHPTLGEDVVPHDACGFDPGLLVVDLVQWSLLDVTARVEYWQALNLRASPLFPHDDASAALLLGLLPLYRPLPAWWILGDLGQGKAASQNRIFNSTMMLHFRGRWKPWLRGHLRYAHVQCTRGDARVGMTAGTPCATLWAYYAHRAIGKINWRAPSIAEAGRAAALAAGAAASNHDEAADDAAMRTPYLESDPQFETGTAPIYISLIGRAQMLPGVVVALNSTLTHASDEARAALRFHVFVPSSDRGDFESKLVGLFPKVGITVSTAPEDRLAKLGSRLRNLGVDLDPMDAPQLWLHYALPGIQRTLLLSADSVVLTDVHELYAASLRGRACAVIEDCSLLFEDIFNYHHPLFSSKHARSSCSSDDSIMVMDLKAWRKEDLPNRIFDLLGVQRRTEGLYAQLMNAKTFRFALMLALDKRALKLPPGWLARGLAREDFTQDELRYWQRQFGQSGVNLPFSRKPYIAAQATASPSRDVGEALVLRFSGGPFLPWLRRCTHSIAAAAPRCGRTQADCASVWRKYFSTSAARALHGSSQVPCLRLEYQPATPTGVENGEHSLALAERPRSGSKQQ